MNKVWNFVMKSGYEPCMKICGMGILEGKLKWWQVRHHRLKLDGWGGGREFRRNENVRVIYRTHVSSSIMMCVPPCINKRPLFTVVVVVVVCRRRLSSTLYIKCFFSFNS